ncbi:MAG: CinA family protein [Prevotella sp.]|nr:CinA family protein [Prevotella sp.]MCM1074629.1 CinA family protein [Ruminococcus sp.]
MENKKHKEERHVVIYGYTREDLQKLMHHFEASLPDYISLSFKTQGECTHVLLKGASHGVELLRFNMNKYQRTLADLFPNELLALEDTTISRILGNTLLDNELTVSSAESCTGGNIAHRIVENSGSSAYFLGSVVSYSNDIKARVLGVNRTLIDRHGAVSRPVVEEMVKGVCSLMHTRCGMATSGIAGPDGGSASKPVGTVWFAVKYDDLTVSEVRYFKGSRNEIIEAATNHAMVMLLNVIRNNYTPPEYGGDE